MEQIFGTFVNIIVYIVIFRVIAGGFSKKKPEKNAPVKVEKNIPKKKKSFFEEALEQLQKFEEQSQGVQREKKKYKINTQAPVPVHNVKPLKIKEEEIIKTGTRAKKIIDEKSQEIYYNNEESVYAFKRKDLKKAIIYSEIIGTPLSRRIGMPYRR